MTLAGKLRVTNGRACKLRSMAAVRSLRVDSANTGVDSADTACLTSVTSQPRVVPSVSALDEATTTTLQTANVEDSKVSFVFPVR